MLKKFKRLSSKVISLISILMFLFMIIIIFISNRYMKQSSDIETTTQENRVILVNLSNQLAKTSDYLTGEARMFAITGDITHFYNYWNEVYENKNRDWVISELSSYNPPENERVLLSRAKAYSDTLISTETLSMKLTLLSQGKSADNYSYDKTLYDYISQVESYELPEEYQELTSQEMKEISINILYDDLYNQYKDLILSPIDDFQLALNTRLDDEVKQSISRLNFASVVQIVCSVIIIIFIAILILGFNLLYLKPLNDYTDKLSSLDNSNNKDFSKIKVTPKGSLEIYQFGEIFNRLSSMLNAELDNKSIAENNMRIAKEQIEKVDNLKSQFFASMSHEFRTPLNAITGYLYLMNDTQLDFQQEKYCKNIKIASEELLGLINNILDFFKIDSGNITFENKNFNLIELLQDVYNLMESHVIQKGISLKLDIKKNVPKFIIGDTLKLRQVLINLLSNGIKFTSVGEVKLSVEYLGNVDGKNLIEFSVSDTGIGIKQEDISKIFEPFIQSNLQYGGTGLGLPISREIVRKFSNNKYDIEVISKINEGSTFSFKLEFLKGEVIEKENVSKTIKKFNSDTSILLIDDNKINLEIEKSILEKFGVKVITANSGLKVLDIIENTHVDIIFLDLYMPDINGYDTAKKIRKIFTDIPIICLTANVISGVKDKVYQSGMNDYLSKPLKVDELQQVLEKYLPIEDTSNVSLFDYQRCLDNLNGDKFLLSDLITRFLENHSASCYKIQKYVDIKNYINARKILHDIIGISGNLCCDRLYHISAKLLEELRNETSQSLYDFSIVWKDTIELLRKNLKNSSNIDYCSNKCFNDKWKKFINLCRNYDTSAIDFFLENKDLFKPFLDKSKLDNIEKNLKQYNFTWILKNTSLKS